MPDIAELAVKADAYKALKDLRLERQREVNTLKEQENQLKGELITALKDADGVNGVVGQTARVELKNKKVPVVENWESLYAHIKETGEFELLQRRVGEGAVKERWEDNVVVPGVGSLDVTDLSVRKV